MFIHISKFKVIDGIKPTWQTALTFAVECKKNSCIFIWFTIEIVRTNVSKLLRFTLNIPISMVNSLIAIEWFEKSRFVGENSSPEMKDCHVWLFKAVDSYFGFVQSQPVHKPTKNIFSRKQEISLKCVSCSVLF